MSEVIAFKPKSKNIMTAKFHLTKDLNSTKADLIIVGAYQEDFPKDKEPELNGFLNEINDACENGLIQIAKLEAFEAKLGSLLVFPIFNKLKAERVLIVGLGSKKELNNLNQIRKACSIAIRRADSLKAKTINFEVFGLENKLDIAQISRAIAEVTLLAPYKFDKYLSQKDENKKFMGIETINLIVPSTAAEKQIQAQLEKALISAEAVLLARELYMRKNSFLRKL